MMFSSSLKKNIHRKDIVAEVTQSGYQQDYQQIAMQMMECRTAEDWMEIYRRLVSWELKLSDTASPMAEMLGMQKEEANQGFAKYIAKNYLDWVSPDNRDRHLMSPDIFKRKMRSKVCWRQSSMASGPLLTVCTSYPFFSRKMMCALRSSISSSIQSNNPLLIFYILFLFVVLKYKEKWNGEHDFALKRVNDKDSLVLFMKTFVLPCDKT